jgi:Rrf2 family protein
VKLNTKARYALTAMTAIARSSDEGMPLSVRSLGRRTQISPNYLGQLLTQLVAVGLLRSLRGRRGGYLLAAPATEISVGQIVAAVVGPINIIECIDRPEACVLSDSCRCRALYRDLNRRICEAFDTVTLADLASQPGISPAKVAELVRTHEQNGELAPGRLPVPCRSLPLSL